MWDIEIQLYPWNRFILGSRSETRQNMHMTDRRSLDVPRSRRNSQSDTDDKGFRKPAATLSMHLKKITLKPTRIGFIDKKETSIVKRTRRCSTYCTILTLHQSRLNSDGIETRHSLKFTAGLTDQFLVIKHKLSRRTYDKRVRKHITFITRLLKTHLIQTRCDKVMN